MTPAQALKSLRALTERTKAVRTEFAARIAPAKREVVLARYGKAPKSFSGRPSTNGPLFPPFDPKNLPSEEVLNEHIRRITPGWLS